MYPTQLALSCHIISWYNVVCPNTVTLGKNLALRDDRIDVQTIYDIHVVHCANWEFFVQAFQKLV